MNLEHFFQGFDLKQGMKQEKSGLSLFLLKSEKIKIHIVGGYCRYHKKMGTIEEDVGIKCNSTKSNIMTDTDETQMKRDKIQMRHDETSMKHIMKIRYYGHYK